MFVLLSFLIVPILSNDVIPEPKVKGEWCPLLSTFISFYNRAKNKFFGSLDGAKAACEKDEQCGAVGLDRIPYRKIPGGPVIYKHTIYLVSDEDVKTRPIVQNHRFNTYLKGPCHE
jgi:hypothetical protein